MHSDRGIDKLYVYLECCSKPGDVEFDCEFRPSIVNKATFSSSINILKLAWATFDRCSYASNWGTSLGSSEILRDKYKEFCPDGKLHLRIAITAINLTMEELNALTAPAKSLKEKLDLKIDFNPRFSKLNTIFDVITAQSLESDVLLRTEDGMVLRAHKSILSKKSTVFKSMFTIDMEETANRSVDIIEFKGSVMQELLRFIYFGNVQNIERMNCELFKAARVYDVAELAEICLKSIISSVDLENVIIIAQLADVHDLPELFDYCCEKIQK